MPPPAKKQKVANGVGDKCTRCCEIIQPNDNKTPILSGCQIPHPEHLQMQIVAFCGGNGMQYTFRCQACGDSYTRTQTIQEMKNSEPGQITKGPKFCYQGNHTFLPVGCLGDCRVKKDLGGHSSS